VLRFVGGKISKNEGGVKVNMPSGALALSPCFTSQKTRPPLPMVKTRPSA
jgi:hypothetical protein